MASDEDRLQAKVANLNASLDELEAQLEPLFTKSLPETLVGLETIQQAKLQVAIPYVLYDLVFGNVIHDRRTLNSPNPAHRAYSVPENTRNRSQDPPSHL